MSSPQKDIGQGPREKKGIEEGEGWVWNQGKGEYYLSWREKGPSLGRETDIEHRKNACKL